MSTYFAATVLVVGRHEHLHALNQYILRAEFGRPAETFSYKRLWLNERLGAALYRSGKSRYEPQLTVAVDDLGDADVPIARLDYCIYLYQDAESAMPAQERVYRRGKALVDQELDYEERNLANAFQVFKQCCRQELSLTPLELTRLDRWMTPPEHEHPPGFLSRLLNAIRYHYWSLNQPLQRWMQSLGRHGDPSSTEAPLEDDTDPF